MKEVLNFLEQEKKAIHQLWLSSNLINPEKIEGLARKILNCLDADGILAFMGNGGSAAEANHLAAEFVGRCVLDHPPLRAISLADNNSILTAIINDYGADEVFARQVRSIINKSSVVVALSTSGTSPNVIKGLREAKSLGAYTVLWTSSKLKENFSFVDEIWKVESDSTPRAQEVHLLWGHLIAETLEHIILS